MAPRTKRKASKGSSTRNTRAKGSNRRGTPPEAMRRPVRTPTEVYSDTEASASEEENHLGHPEDSSDDEASEKEPDPRFHQLKRTQHHDSPLPPNRSNNRSEQQRSNVDGSAGGRPSSKPTSTRLPLTSTYGSSTSHNGRPTTAPMVPR